MHTFKAILIRRTRAVILVDLEITTLSVDILFSPIKLMLREYNGYLHAPIYASLLIYSSLHTQSDIYWTAYYPLIQYNGVNLLKVVAKDPIAYARNLLDLMFTKREQRQSLVLPTSKSSKPPLDQEKVTKFFGKYTVFTA